MNKLDGHHSPAFRSTDSEPSFADNPPVGPWQQEIEALRTPYTDGPLSWVIRTGAGDRQYGLESSGADLSDLLPALISDETLMDAMLLAAQCFENPFDRVQLSREYGRFIAGQRSFFEPALQRVIQVHADFVYKHSEKVVALAGVYQHLDEADRAWLSWFGVDPELRGKGVGTQVLGHIEEVSRRLNISRLAAYTEDRPDNQPNQRFYEKHDYIWVESMVVGNEHMRVYEKELTTY